MTVIDEYLAKISLDQRTELERVRQIVYTLADDCSDTIGYGMPVIKYKGKYLIGFAPFKDHLSIFPGAGPVNALKDELSGYKTSKGTVQFTPEKPLSNALLTRIIEFRKNEIDGA